MNQSVEIGEVLEVVEIEVFAIEDKPLPQAKRYVIRVDKTKVTIDKAEITGAEILALVGKTPAQFKLYEHRRHQQPKLVQPNEVVYLHRHRIERFTTMPKDTTEGNGSATLSRAFELPKTDQRYLDSLEREWESIVEVNTQWLIIHGWELPEGYNYKQVDLALLVPPLYPDSQIDMVYVKPHLARSDGRSIPALAHQLIQGVLWQRWSRHRTTQNPWRIGVDDIAGHLALVDDWFRREFERR